VIDKCAQRGILVMLDNQRSAFGSDIPPLWYDNNTYTEAYVLSAWDTLLQRFGSKWNLFALDLKNEPHTIASWGMDWQWSDWNKAVERFITHLSTNNPTYRGLFFVEGIDTSPNVDTPNPNPYGCFWGENLMGVERHPIRTGNTSLDNRVIYSPHVYGPDVFHMTYFDVGNFPANMPEIWDLHYGYVAKMKANPVIIGEWGGRYAQGSLDERWANALVQYMRTNCLTDQFYWCLNPNGGDTGGVLLDDWTTGDARKLDLLRQVQPNPTVISPPQLGTICVQHGTTPMC